MANTAVFLNSPDVNVSAAGALAGDGSIGDPLQVEVDGVTVTINGSNQLVAAGGLGGTIAATQVAYGTGADTLGGNAGLTFAAANALGGVVQVAYNRTTLTGAATTLVLTDDSFEEVATPFSFTFYGDTYNSVFVGSNGYVSFGTGHTSSSVDFSAGSVTGAPILGYAVDLNPGSAGTIKYETFGVTPNRVFVVEWAGVPVYGSTASLFTFQIKLTETTSVFEIHTTTATATFTDDANVSQGAAKDVGSTARYFGTRGIPTKEWSLSEDGVRFLTTIPVTTTTGRIDAAGLSFGSDTSTNGQVFYSVDGQVIGQSLLRWNDTKQTLVVGPGTYDGNRGGLGIISSLTPAGNGNIFHTYTTAADGSLADVLALVTSGDSDWYFRDSGVSLIFHVTYDAKNYPLFKIGEDSVQINGSAGTAVFSVFPTDGTGTALFGNSEFYNKTANAYTLALPTTITTLKVAMQTPASAAATGTKDTIAFDTNYLYICTATDTWKRVAIATWP